MEITKNNSKNASWVSGYDLFFLTFALLFFSGFVEWLFGESILIWQVDFYLPRGRERGCCLFSVQEEGIFGSRQLLDTSCCSRMLWNISSPLASFRHLNDVGAESAPVLMTELNWSVVLDRVPLWIFGSRHFWDVRIARLWWEISRHRWLLFVIWMT